MNPPARRRAGFGRVSAPPLQHEAKSSGRDSSLGRRHKVDRSRTHIFHSMRGFHVVTGIVLVVLALGPLLGGEAAALAYPGSKWAQGNSTSDYIGIAVLGLLLVWVGIRLVRVGVRITGDKITIRGYFVTRKVNASEIHSITLQPKDNGQGQLRWIPRVELTSEKSFWINSFDCGPARKPPKPELTATIAEIRTLAGCVGRQSLSGWKPE